MGEDKRKPDLLVTDFHGELPLANLSFQRRLESRKRHSFDSLDSSLRWNDKRSYSVLLHKKVVSPNHWQQAASVTACVTNKLKW